MDNRIFNVNGKGDEMLYETLSLVFKQDGMNTFCKSFLFKKTHGLILCWVDDVKGVHTNRFGVA